MMHAKTTPQGCLILCMCLTLTGLAGCADRESNQLVGVGSSTSVLAMQEWRKALASQGVSLSYRSNGEETAKKELLDGSADFLLTTRHSTEDVSQAKLIGNQAIVSLPILASHIALVHTQKGCSLELSKEEVRAIFIGNITNFRALGCADEPIQVLTRERDSGTRQNLYRYLGLSSPEEAEEAAHEKTIMIAPNMENVINLIPGAFGYMPGPLVSFDNEYTIAIKDHKGVSHKPIIAAQESNTLGKEKGIQDYNSAEDSPEYPVVSTIYLVLKANGNGKKLEAIKKFVSYALSPKAQVNVERLGYVKLTKSEEALASNKLKTIEN